MSGQWTVVDDCGLALAWLASELNKTDLSNVGASRVFPDENFQVLGTATSSIQRMYLLWKKLEDTCLRQQDTGFSNVRARAQQRILTALLLEELRMMYPGHASEFWSCVSIPSLFRGWKVGYESQSAEQVAESV